MEKDQNGDNITKPLQAPGIRRPRIMCSAMSKNCISRKRNDLTIDRKLKIIEEFTNGVQINVILKKYNINQSHLSSIIRRKAAILQDFHTYGRKQRKRIAKRTKYAPINEEVFRWLISLNCHVSGSIIQNKAKMFAEQLKISGFRASNGWLECFRKKFNVNAYKDMNNPYVTTNTQPNENSESPLPQTKQELFHNPPKNGGTDEVNNRSTENVFNATPASNDSFVSSVTPKSPPSYCRRSAQSSNSNGNNNNESNSYSHHYRQANYQTISPLLNSSTESPILPPSNMGNVGANYYGVENANPNNRLRNLINNPTLHSTVLSSTSYHSSNTENLPMHHLFNKPLHPSNPNNNHDIYGYSPSSYQKNSQVSSSYAGYMPTNSTHLIPQNQFQNQNTPNEIANLQNSYEPNHMFYPVDQSRTPKNTFNATPTMPMKRFINDYNDMAPNMTPGNHIQQQPPTLMHGNVHTPNVTSSNWNDSLATLPSYTVDLVSSTNPNSSMYYPRTPYPSDSTPPMGYPYNPVNRSRPSFHQNQPKDFY